ncbi:MAG: flagellar hook-basal body complex protein FliE [Armatimonadota bacterium]|nr:flagellar hook-basal body complex protein FliE [bacterium]MCS7308822.1 flagellar hook-basal body complex protein FliE [Armatimonadota bacterium]MDW8291252.1 flagellar hook-basal body complex protein FliE [Armatimonadota bacterium]
MEIRLNSTLPGVSGTSTLSAPLHNRDDAPSFAETLKEVFGKINEMQLHSAELARQFATGETDDLVRVVTASEEASVALQLAVQVRNKVIEAYQEIMRMQV